MSAGPTRFPSGVATDVFRSVLGNYGAPNPIQWITYWNDMTNAPGPTLPNATDQQYTVTKTGAGTIANTDGAGGLSLITNAAGAADAVFVQGKGEAFRFVSNKRMLFQARFALNHATLSSAVIGLQITDTTPLDATDGIFFLKSTAAAALQFKTVKGGVASTLAMGNVVAATYYTVGFYYNGIPVVVGGVTSYVFDVYLDGLPIGQVTASSTVPDTEDLCISLGVQNGEAVAKTMTVDYIFAAVER